MHNGWNRGSISIGLVAASAGVCTIWSARLGLYGLSGRFYHSDGGDSWDSIHSNSALPHSTINILKILKLPSIMTLKLVGSAILSAQPHGETFLLLKEFLRCFIGFDGSLYSGMTASLH
jgi:hypothetical protein